jgi:hypothetical protein
MQKLFNRLRPVLNHTSHCKTASRQTCLASRVHYLHHRSVATAMASVASTSKPAQIPALDSPHAQGTQLPKAKKDKKEKKETPEASGHPLEVWRPASYSFWALTFS